MLLRVNPAVVGTVKVPPVAVTLAPGESHRLQAVVVDEAGEVSAPRIGRCGSPPRPVASGR